MTRPVSRRTLLRGAGAAMALPWLDAMSGSALGAKRLAKPPIRTAFLFMPNGVAPELWTPAGTGESYQADTPFLEPIAPFQDDFLLLENLWHKETVGRNGHWPKVPAFLSGGFVVRTTGRYMDTGGTSVDQLLADRLGSRTPLPSIELGVDSAYTGVDNVGGGFTRIYGSHIAWRDPHTPLPNEIIPQLAFDRLFRSGSIGPAISGINPNQPQVAKSLQRDDVSVLDQVREDARELQQRVGADDRQKLDEYFTAVRSVERRIEAAMKPQRRWINEGRFDLDRPGPGIPENHQEHVRLMLDILVLSFWVDATRIATFMFGNAQTGRNFSFLDGVRGSFHGLSHHRDEEATKAQYVKIGIWHMHQLAYLLGRMKSLKEGEGTLLDNSLLLFGSTIKDGNRHDEHDLPLILAGRGAGAVRPGRRLTFEQDTPLCNLYLAMLHQMGVEAEAFGDSTAPLSRLS